MRIMKTAYKLYVLFKQCCDLELESKKSRRREDTDMRKEHLENKGQRWQLNEEIQGQIINERHLFSGLSQYRSGVGNLFKLEGSINVAVTK